MVEHFGHKGGDKLDGVLRFQHHHIELAVARKVLVSHLKVELDLREVRQYHANAGNLHGFAIDGEREGGNLGLRVREGGLEICHVA